MAINIAIKLRGAKKLGKAYIYLNWVNFKPDNCENFQIFP